jgi:hypothetical protein
MAWLDALDIPVLCASTELVCRYLYINRLTGTLPAAWSALAGLNMMWVPCALLSRVCRLAVSTCLHVRQAVGAAVPLAANQARGQHQATRPALLQIGCLQQQPLQLPALSLSRNPPAQLASSPQQLHPHTLQLVQAVHSANMTATSMLMIMLTII